MKVHHLCRLATMALVVAPMLAAAVHAAPRPAAWGSPKPAATSQPAAEVDDPPKSVGATSDNLQKPAAAAESKVPLETLRNTFANLQKAAAAAEGKNTPAGQSAALEQYRKMQQMIERFPDLKTDPETKGLVARKIAELQPKVTDSARQQDAQERAERAARSARERAAHVPGPVFVGGGAAYGGGGGSRSAGAGSSGASACPPGAARSGST